MTFRRLPGAMVLGLVAALVTHAILFGREHAWGGAYHSAFVQFTLAAATSLTAAACALLWSGARCAADGTVLTTRMRELVPGWASVAASGAAWYTFGECLEAAHTGVPLLAIAVILAAVAWLLLRFASSALRALAGFVFAIVRSTQLPRRLPFDFARYARYAQDDKANDDSGEFWRRRFTRPPPVIANA